MIRRYIELQANRYWWKLKLATNGDWTLTVDIPT